MVKVIALPGGRGSELIAHDLNEEWRGGLCAKTMSSISPKLLSQRIVVLDASETGVLTVQKVRSKER
jgi:hypothetical protein